MIAYSICSNLSIAQGNVPAGGIPIGGTVPNVLQGTPFDLVTEDGIFSLYLNQEPTGEGTPGAQALTHTLYLIENGVQKTIIPTSGLFMGSSGGSLKVNENLVMRFRVKAGSRLGHTITNTSPTALGFFNAHYVLE